MVMGAIYKFYLYWKEDEYIEYNLEDITKEEMDCNIIYNIFPSSFHCVREKRVDWELEYRNVFLLEERRNNPDYISNFKRLWTEQE
jgi:hypothetical protein